MGNYAKGIKAGEMADSLQAGLQTTSTSLGYVYEQMGNHLFAEEYHRKAIELNSRHFLPFERLGYVYMNTTDYAAADSFFYEADLRKKGYHFEGNLWGPTRFVLPTFPVDFIQCTIDTSILDKRDVFAFFTWGVQEYESGKYANAVRVLNKVIVLDKTNPLVFHYLGKIYFDQQKW
jgi:tetratricopeptide (TPR) repeat protein